MEVVVAGFVTLILASVLIHLIRLGIAMYTLKESTAKVAQKLGEARERAMERNERVSVIFSAKDGRFGIDRNKNGRLEYIEAEELPDGVVVGEDAVVTFTMSGKLAPGSKEPEIHVSNTRNTRTVSVSSLGAIEID